MNIDDIINANGEKASNAAFFTRMWEELHVPAFKLAPGIMEDLREPRRTVNANLVPQVVMKGMDHEDNPFIIFKSKGISFYQEGLLEARQNNCKTRSCCPAGMGAHNVTILFKHADVEVSALVLKDGLIEPIGDSYNYRILFDPENATREVISPARVLMLLSGQKLSNVDSDGETHLVMLDV